MRKTSIFCLLLFVFLSLTAEQCTQDKEEYITLTYKTMVTAAIVYDTTMKSVADLYDKEQVSETFKDTVILYGTKYWQAYHALQQALENYASGVLEKSDVEKAKTEFDKALLDFTINAAMGVK